MPVECKIRNNVNRLAIRKATKNILHDDIRLRNIKNVPIADGIIRLWENQEELLSEFKNSKEAFINEHINKDFIEKAIRSKKDDKLTMIKIAYRVNSLNSFLKFWQ